MKKKSFDTKIKVAGLVLNLHIFDDDVLTDSIKDYITDDEKTDFEITEEYVDTPIVIPTGKKMTNRKDENWYLSENGAYEYVLYDIELGIVSLKINFDIKNLTAKIELVDVKELYGIDDNCFAYNAMEKAFRFILLLHNGFTFHASSIIYNGEGVAFSAVSGTGKSTHTALWLKNYPGTEILNDDRPAIRRIDGTWCICGTPWAGTTGINTNKVVPLKALVFLERSDDNHICDCSAMEAIYKFFEAVFHPFTDELTNIMLGSLNSLLCESRICSLGCNMNDDAAETVRKYLFD